MARTKGNHEHDKTNKKAVIAVAQRIKSRFDLHLAADPKFYIDKEVILAAVAANGRNLRHASPELKEDREVVCVAVASDGAALYHCGEHFKSDRDIVRSAIQSSNGEALRYGNPRFRCDPELVQMAVKKNGCCLEYASEELRDDKDLVLTAILNTEKLQCRDILGYASERLRGDREVVMAAIENCAGFRFSSVSKTLRNDREVVLAAIEKNGAALQYAPQEIKADRDLVRNVVAKNGMALEFVADGLKGDREIATVALEAPDFLGHGGVLAIVPETLQNDRDFVLKAVSRAGFDLRYAPAELRADREVVETALANRNSITASAILELASEELRGDRILARKVIADDSKAFYVLSEDLQMDPDIVALAWKTVDDDHDFDIWHDFRGSNFRKRCITKLVTLYKQVQARNQLKAFSANDPDSTLQFAEGWLAESLEKKWLLGKLIQTKLPSSLYSQVNVFTGIDEDREVAAQLTRFFPVVCHVKKGLADNYGTDAYEDFVRDANVSFGSGASED